MIEDLLIWVLGKTICGILFFIALIAAVIALVVLTCWIVSRIFK